MELPHAACATVRVILVAHGWSEPRRRLPPEARVRNCVPECPIAGPVEECGASGCRERCDARSTRGEGAGACMPVDHDSGDVCVSGLPRRDEDADAGLGIHGDPRRCGGARQVVETVAHEAVESDVVALLQRVETPDELERSTGEDPRSRRSRVSRHVRIPARSLDRRRAVQVLVVEEDGVGGHLAARLDTVPLVSDQSVQAWLRATNPVPRNHGSVSAASLTVKSCESPIWP